MRSSVALRHRGAAVGLCAIALLITASALWSSDDSATGAAAERKSSAFAVVGDGSLPDDRPELLRPRDPLTAAETGYAIHRAITHPSVPSGATDVRGEPGPEVLFADLPDAAGASTRREAVVNLYDYSSDTALQQVVDLASGSVSSVQSPDLHPPLSSAEGEVALRLAIDKGPASLAMKQQFEQVHGSPLVGADQVGHVAGVFIYDGTTAFGGECGRHRCAQLLIRLPSGDYLDTTDFVIDLSTKTVITSREG